MTIAFEKKNQKFTSRYPSKIGLAVRQGKHGAGFKVVNPVSKLPKAPVRIVKDYYPAKLLNKVKVGRREIQ